MENELLQGLSVFAVFIAIAYASWRKLTGRPTDDVVSSSFDSDSGGD